MRDRLIRFIAGAVYMVFIMLVSLLLVGLTCLTFTSVIYLAKAFIADWPASIIGTLSGIGICALVIGLVALFDWSKRNRHNGK